MYRAKQGGWARSEVFDPSMNAAALERLALETDLHHAIGPGGCTGFWVENQPLIELSTGRVAGLGALVRWQHAAQGIISPARFIPLAEEMGPIVQLGRWVLREACRQACLADAGTRPGIVDRRESLRPPASAA